MSDTHTQEAKMPKVLPKPNSDFYQTFQMLSEAEQATVTKVREFMKASVAPIINDFWEKDSFPFDVLPGFRDLQVMGAGYEGYGCAGGSNLLACYVAMEIAKVDCSFATFFGVHSGLAMGSIFLCGSEEQKKKWLPPMARMEKIGSFGLTEPLVGSGASRGLGTTARREGDTWILNGQKKWIGNSTFGDLTIIWARDVADNQVKGFIVENKTPGFKVEKIQHKMALRVVQNGLITLEDCKVPEENRLQNDTSFRDTARVLRMTRGFVAWEAVGCQMGAYENALQYAQQREQFRQADRFVPTLRSGTSACKNGRQHHRACQCMVIRPTSHLQGSGASLLTNMPSLAKAILHSSRCAETSGQVCKRASVEPSWNRLLTIT